MLHWKCQQQQFGLEQNDKEQNGDNYKRKKKQQHTYKLQQCVIWTKSGKSVFLQKKTQLRPQSRHNQQCNDFPTLRNCNSCKKQKQKYVSKETGLEKSETKINTHCNQAEKKQRVGCSYLQRSLNKRMCQCSNINKYGQKM